jgi:lipopolysaccharide/colanic/teichoic acid biosynthesis glycosyltransferase
MGQRFVILFSRRQEPDFVQGVMRDFRASNFLQVARFPELELLLKSKTVIFIVLGRDLTLEEREKALFLGLNMGIKIGIIPGFYESMLAGAEPVPVGDIPVVIFPSLIQRRKSVKRLISQGVAGLALILLSPLFALISMSVLLSSRGPIFYGQERVGQYGRTFVLWKFRTMIDRAEDSTGPIFCQENDPRVTRIGRILRKTHLDELPQLFNIFKGEMAWIGPRPERPIFVRKFEQSVDKYALRHLVPPGITGEAQVNIQYDAEPDAKLTYDLQHLRRQGFIDDARTLLATIPAILGRKGKS